MVGALISLIMLLIMALIVIMRQFKEISMLKESVESKQRVAEEVYRLMEFYKRKYNQESFATHTKIVREVPKGTVQAVKMAMKMSHPDNGGKEVDFIMYRRAYNILTGKEKA